MDYKRIKKIAEGSFINNKLNPKIINLVSKKLKRSELKKYIKALRQIEKKKTIYLILPEITDSKDIEYLLNYLKDFYPDKDVEIQKNPKLIAGLKIINDDLVYEYNVKDALNNLVSQINKDL